MRGFVPPYEIFLQYRTVHNLGSVFTVTLRFGTPSLVLVVASSRMKYTCTRGICTADGSDIHNL